MPALRLASTSSYSQPCTCACCGEARSILATSILRKTVFWSESLLSTGSSLSSTLLHSDAIDFLMNACGTVQKVCA
ncbi:hypothetical protein IQ06DRAFT_91115 [Phaeosphaeriaceae sp. SRC1lsM3a]|nr:hypothetical protein IQ06DRAFT_91115 [Stagonospora sp. SRC1lsM3a]